MPKASIGDLRLAWDDTGPAPGLPLVLLHAFPLNRRMWRPQVQALAGRRRVITPDFRGHGDSTCAEEDSTMERLAGDVCRLLDHLGLDRIVLGGLSMGGYVALAFCRLYAARVAALVLADTRAGADTEEGRQGRFEMAALVEKEGAGVAAERLLPKLLAPATLAQHPEIVAAAREMILAASPQGIARALRGMAARPDSTPLLAGIRCPTLVLVGEEDALTPSAEAEKLAGAIPGAQLGRIPGAAHLSNLEQPDGFNRLLGDFLAQLSP